MKLDYPIRQLGQIFTQLRVQDLHHFEQETWRQKKFRSHEKTQCIFLRHWKNRNMDTIELQDYPLISVYRETLEGILYELSKYYDFKDYTAIITNLRAGASIPKHTDNGKIFELGHRIHIPIKTNSQVIFHCGDQSINMKLDYAYEIGNTSHIHAVDNNSGEDRYHLILDLFPNMVI